MPQFTEVRPYSGLSTTEGSAFLAVPLDLATLVMLEGASPRDLEYEKGRLEIQEVTDKNKLDIAKKLHPAIKPELTKAMAAVRSGNHLLSVKGRRIREATIKATKGAGATLTVGVFDPKSYTIAFKFLRHGAQAKTTKFTIKDADGWLTQLNAIYGLQANVSFTMGEAASDAPVSTVLSQPLSDGPFLQHVAVQKSKDAQLTIFFVGKWTGNDRHANGTFFANESVAVIDDEPIHPKLDAAIDPVVLTIAHEVGHFVLNKRGFEKQNHHNSRDRVLLSSGIQSTRIDKQLALHLNSY